MERFFYAKPRAAFLANTSYKLTLPYKPSRIIALKNGHFFMSGRVRVLHFQAPVTCFYL